MPIGTKGTLYAFDEKSGFEVHWDNAGWTFWTEEELNEGTILVTEVTTND